VVQHHVWVWQVGHDLDTPEWRYKSATVARRRYEEQVAAMAAKYGTGTETHHSGWQHITQFRQGDQACAEVGWEAT